MKKSFHNIVLLIYTSLSRNNVILCKNPVFRGQINKNNDYISCIWSSRTHFASLKSVDCLQVYEGSTMPLNHQADLKLRHFIIYFISQKWSANQYGMVLFMPKQISLPKICSFLQKMKVIFMPFLHKILIVPTCNMVASQFMSYNILWWKGTTSILRTG